MPKVPQAALLLEPEETASYEMLPHEGEASFHKFVHYRELPPGRRGVAKAWEDHVRKCMGKEPGTLGYKMCPNRWRQLATAFSWQQRARDWDREVDRRTREKLAADQIAARVRHQQLAQASLAALSIPGRVILQALQNPTVMPGLVEYAQRGPSELLKVLDMVTWTTKNMPGMVDVERMSLGMATESIEMGIKPEQTGFEIASDEVATDLAIKLVTQLANKQLTAGAAEDTEQPAIEVEPDPDESP